MAAAAAALFGLWGSNAAALSLGRITVQSALGEPLRAEIDVLDINAEEAASLKAATAPPDAYRAAGLEYNPALPGLRATLQRRADGRAYLRLSSDRAISDPFVDLIFEASWATGRIVRDYTLLFDPPTGGLRQSATVAPTPAQVPTPSPATPAATTLQPSVSSPSPRPTPTARATPLASKVPKAPAMTTRPVTVKAGDTASKIAAASKSASVSLDQMLVALLRTNPRAFVDNNVNRLKAGAVIHVPTAAQAEAIPADEAGRVIVAQSKNFSDFRRKLAGSAPVVHMAAADRQASGQVRAQVEDKKNAATAPDKLTLSKGALQAKAAAEEQLSRERSTRETASRAAEITRNIQDLNKLGAASSVAAPPQPAVSAAMPVVAGPTVTAPMASAPVASSAAASQPASAASATATPAASAPGAVASTAATRPLPAPMPPAEVSLVDELLDSPLAPAGAVGLIALLAGLGVYRRVKQRKNAAQVNSAFLESRLRPDSFFAASGGQHVNTPDSVVPGTAIAQPSSQPDAASDVDPVAEADVYLAYGRDVQAEEILRDALRLHPERLAIHQKLLEIFAQRRDRANFEEIARLALAVTHGNGPDWQRACELGLSIDPDNALYQPGGTPLPDDLPAGPRPIDTVSSATANTASAPSQAVAPLPASAPVDLDLDLDLDFSLAEEPARTISETATRPVEADASRSADEAGPPTLDLDFGMTTDAAHAPVVEQGTAHLAPLEFSLPALDIVDNEPASPAIGSDPGRLQSTTSFDATQPADLESAQALEPPASELGMLEFDLEPPPAAPADTPAVATTFPLGHEDPLATKLALAEEFSAIGDEDGARALIEEVIQEATGDMKIRAQQALSQL